MSGDLLTPFKSLQSYYFIPMDVSTSQIPCTHSSQRAESEAFEICLVRRYRHFHRSIKNPLNTFGVTRLPKENGEETSATWTAGLFDSRAPARRDGNAACAWFQEVYKCV